MSVWKTIEGYEGMYEISDQAEIRRVAGEGLDGRRVSQHRISSSRAQNGMRYVSLWKDGKRKSFMQHKLYAAAFHLTENEAARRIYYGFRGDKEAIDTVRDCLKELALEFKKEENSGKDRHDEILYIEAFLEELDTDGVRGIQ